MKLKYEFDDNDYEYEIDYQELVEQFMKEFGVIKIVAKYIIDEFDLWETLEERYEDDLLELFETEAYEQYQEDKEYDKDKDSYYGVNRQYD